MKAAATAARRAFPPGDLAPLNTITKGEIMCLLIVSEFTSSIGGTIPPD
ncbi:MAG: hypothetical protein IPF98_03060 [Gemmatimonadetes bacterium]|nr:hypothetical protein [Gemmatimonadota bacterium]